MRRVWAGALLVSVAVLAGCGGRDLHARARMITVAPARAPQVVRIDVVHGPLSSSDSIATGFVLRPGRIFTVAHVLGAHGMRALVRLRSPGDEGAALPARVLSVDQRNDVAVLAARTGPGGAASAGAGAGWHEDAGAHVGAEAHIGARDAEAVVLVIRGGALRFLPARLRRRILATIRTPDGRRVVTRRALELRADIQPGDSGAPVLAQDGRVLGMVFAQADGAADVAYALDARVLP